MTESPLSFTSFDEAQTAHRALLKERNASTPPEEFIPRALRFLDAVTHLGEIISDSKQRSQSQTILDYWVSVLFRAGHDVPDTLLNDFDLNQQPDLDDNACPYVGLSVFTADESAHFFGRGHVLSQLLKRMEENAVVVVTGRPGSGASSLVAAGLIPALQPEYSAAEILPVLCPGSDPMDALNTSMADATDQTAQPHNHQVLTVDNIEELFSHCDDEENRLEFMCELEKFVTTANSNNRLVIVSSVSFRDRIIDTSLNSTEWFQAQFSSQSYRIPPMTFSELRSVITEPARKVGLHFDDNVIAELLDDVYGEPAALPLLQFSLARLWKFRSKNRIRYETYQQVGGGRRALQIAAEHLWNTLDAGEQETCRTILCSLVTIGKGHGSPGQTGQDSDDAVLNRGFDTTRVNIGALKRQTSDPCVFDRVLDRLIAEGLLRKIQGHSSISPQIELAHEALFHWQRYGTWLDEIRLELRNSQWLEAIADEYVQYGQLLNAETLSHAKFCLDKVGTFSLSDSVSDLIEHSERTIQKQEERKFKRTKRLKRGIFVLSALLAITIYLLYANIAKEKALVTSIAVVTERAETFRGNIGFMSNVVESALKALEKENYDSVRQSLIALQSASNSLSTNTEAFTLEFRNRQFINQSVDIEKRQASLPSLVADTVTSHEGVQLWGIDFSSKHHEVALARANGEVIRIETNDIAGPVKALKVIAPRKSLDGNTDSPPIVNDVVYSDDGKYIAAGGVDGMVSVWQLPKEQNTPNWQCSVPGTTVDRVYSIQFATLDKRVKIFAGLDIDRAVMWDLKQQCQPGKPQAPERSFASKGDVFAIDWQADMLWLAMGSADETATVWSLQENCGLFSATPETCANRVFQGHTGPIFSVEFAPACRGGPEDPNCKLLTSGADRSLRVWSAQSGQETITRIQTQEYQLGHVKYSPDGKWVAAATGGGAVLIWQFETLAQSLPPDYVARNLGGPVFDIAFASDCKSECNFRLYAGSFAGRFTRIVQPTSP